MKIAVLPGDGIGPEVTACAEEALALARVVQDRIGEVNALIGLAQRNDRRAALASGVLIGSGGLFLYGAITTVAACLDDRPMGGRALRRNRRWRRSGVRACCCVPTNLLT